MATQRIKVQQSYYHPKTGKKLPVIQPIHGFGINDSNAPVDLCVPSSKESGNETYQPVIITKAEYIALLGVHGSLALRNYQGKYGSISFAVPAWDRDYEIILSAKLRNSTEVNVESALQIQDIPLENNISEEDIEEELFGDASEAVSIEPIVTHGDAGNGEEEEEAKKVLEATYSNHLKAMQESYDKGDLENAEKEANSALLLKPKSKKAAAILGQIEETKKNAQPSTEESVENVEDL